jgi:hypothetical protein
VRALLKILLCLVVGACAREPRHRIDRVEVEGATATDNAVMALSPAQVKDLFTQKLRARPAFELAPSGAKPSANGYRAGLTLEFTREAQKEGREGTWAEVGATLELRALQGELSRYEVIGLGEVQIPGDTVAQRQGAVRQALGSALDQIVDSAQLMLRATVKPDRALVQDLSSKDPREREFASRVLADRRHPAAAEPLMERLKSEDPDEVRRAIGSLVELKDPRAVPALIDLARAKDLVFLREIVFALGAIGGEESQAYLFTVAQGHDQPEIRAAAEQSLKELAARASRKAPENRP